MFLVSVSIKQESVESLVWAGAPTVSSRVTVRVLKHRGIEVRSQVGGDRRYFGGGPENSVVRVEHCHRSARPCPDPIIDRHQGGGGARVTAGAHQR